MLPDDLVTDQALADAGGDQFHHSAIAKAVADLGLSSATPVNIALFGPWGSGKSTFYNLMKGRVEQQDRHVTVAYYDAWKYGGHALKRNFIQSVARDLGIESSDLDRDLNLNQEQSRIRLGRWLKYNWRSIAAALGIALVVAMGWAAVDAAVEAKWIHPSERFKEVLPQQVSEAWVVLAGVLAALLLGPKALESAVFKTTRPAIERDDEFARLFTRLVRRIKDRKDSHRVIFFIDELDRCEPDDVVATLVDLKTFLDEDDCVFVVAADRDVLEHALRKVPQAKPIRDDDPYYSTPGAFIDKIFQHQIALPPLRTHALSSFAHRLVSDTKHGLWHALQTADASGRLFDDVVYILIPAHVSSPRRVKVLLNNFAANARVAESRHIDWISRARELAFLTVLDTEFPNVAASLVRFPDLLAYLRGEKTVATTPDLSEDRRALVDQFALVPVIANEESVAGRIVRDSEQPDKGDNAREARAKKELARQLHDYLGKLAVVGELHDPRPDLFYLRVVGYDEGITDPELGEMIDMAAERLPQTVVDAFVTQPDSIKRVAALLLMQSLAVQRGTGQANVLESACRITQELPFQYVQQVAHLAPEVLTHVGRSTWRRSAIPGAVRLAAAQEHPGDQVQSLMDLLDPADADDAAVLQDCLPALEWMGDDAATPVHLAIARFLPAQRAPLATVLCDLPPQQGERAWNDMAGTIETQFGTDATATRLTIFDEIVDALLGSSEPEPLLWRALFLALDSKATDLVERIHERRDELLPRLTQEHQTLVALYEIEIGPEDNWADWTHYLHDPEAGPADRVSSWARDAANVIAAKIPTATSDLTPVFAPVAALTQGNHRREVSDTVLEQFSDMTWGSSADPQGLRWSNLRSFAEQVIIDSDQQARYAQALVESLTASVTARMATAGAATPIPATVSGEWRSRITQLPAAQARDLEARLADVTAPTPAMSVELLRLRIAARHRYNGPALTKKLLLPLAGQPTASAMVDEWLSLKPRYDNAFEVHQSIPIRPHAFRNYAASLTPEARTSLWIRLEEDSASIEDLEAVGEAGVLGEAISHMTPKILRAAPQSKRNATANRLMTATFAEVPTRAERDKGEEVGHKEATRLAVSLIATNIYDNTLLAGRIVIHSGGVAYRNRGTVRDAFNAYAHGDQNSNFNTAQAKALQELGMLTPKKRGRWSRLKELLT